MMRSPRERRLTKDRTDLKDFIVESPISNRRDEVAVETISCSRVKKNTSLLRRTEELLLVWIKDLLLQNTPPTTAAIVAKAKSIHAHLRSCNPTDIILPRGWFVRCLSKADFISLIESTVTLKVDTDFYDKRLKHMIQNGKYKPEQIFTCTKTTFCWKPLPYKTYYRKSCDKMTGLFCMNASGDFKCKPLLIFSDINDVPLINSEDGEMSVHLRTDKKADLKFDILNDWFENCFVPEVVKYLRDKDFSFKVVLLCHSSVGQSGVVADLYPNINVVFSLPGYNISCIVPLQIKIRNFKIHYQKKLLYYLLTLMKKNSNKNECMREFSLATSINMIAQTWNETPMESANKNGLKELIKLAQKVEGENVFDDIIEEEMLELIHAYDNEVKLPKFDIQLRDLSKECENDRKKRSKSATIHKPSAAKTSPPAQKVNGVESIIQENNKDTMSFDVPIIIKEEPPDYDEKIDEFGDSSLPLHSSNDLGISHSDLDASVQICRNISCDRCKMLQISQSLLAFHFCVFKCKKCVICSDLGWMLAVYTQIEGSTIHIIRSSKKCCFCLSTFATVSALQSHICSALNTIENQVHFCSECNAPFSTILDWTKHIYTLCGTKSFQCYYCSKDFTDRNYLRNHEIRWHETEEGSSSGRIDTIPKIIRNKPAIIKETNNLLANILDTTESVQYGEIISSDVVIKTECDIEEDDFRIELEDNPVKEEIEELMCPQTNLAITYTDPDSIEFYIPNNLSPEELAAAKKFYANKIFQSDWKFQLQLQRERLEPIPSKLQLCDKEICQICSDNQSALCLLRHHFCPYPNEPNECFVCAHLLMHLNHAKRGNDGILHLKPCQVVCYFCHEVCENAEQIDKHNCKMDLSVTRVQCLRCGISRPAGDKFVLHLFYHSNVKAYCCYLCTSKLVNAEKFVAHVRAHTAPRKYVCNLCGESFIHKREHVRHMFNHGSVKPHKCELCGKTFAARYMLKQHGFTHTNFRPYACDKCDRAYSKERTLQMHIFQCHQDAGVTCELCGKKLLSWMTMKSHIALHDKDKLHPCHICRRAYTTSASLKRHILTHSGEKKHSCEICGLSFYHMYQLRLHEGTHAEIKPHQCQYCVKTFIQKRQKVAHELKCPLKTCTQTSPEVEVM